MYDIKLNILISTNMSGGRNFIIIIIFFLADILYSITTLNLAHYY